MGERQTKKNRAGKPDPVRGERQYAGSWAAWRSTFKGTLTRILEKP